MRSITKREEKIFSIPVGGIENKIFIKIGDRKVFAKPEEDTERTSEDGKASSVHFLHFEFDEDLVQLFINGDNDVIIGFDHPNYKHFSEISKASINELSNDFDINH